MTAFRTILVPVADAASGQAAFETALALGRDLGSHVQALHVRLNPADAVPLVGEGMSGAMVEEMMSVAEQQAADRAAAARAAFDGVCARLAVPVVDVPPAPDRLSAGWQEEVGREEEVVATRSRLFDLVVVGQPVPDTELPSTMTLNAALMESGRPLLMAPPTAATTLGRTVAIAWNGSAEAARAVGAALPLLARASKVVILSAREPTPSALAPSELAAHLRWHGITAACHTFPLGASDTGEALMREVAEAGADLLVMGAYTHSRLRQLILGGVTRYVLHHAGIPVFMAH